MIQAVEVDWWEAEAGPWVTKGEKVTAGGRGAGQGGDLIWDEAAGVVERVVRRGEGERSG
jgi:hypothetical protein